ncbi:MAG: hypothetical protein LUQ65_12860, partial [Candidatus Helarchaeota archaeon]|nr:hypothetical protein [Candidatus Helarchaeota archaeon]
ADPTFYLPDAQSVIGFAVALDPEIVRAFLGKKSITAQEKMSQLEGETYHKLEGIGEAIKALLESEGYKAVNCEVNMDYRRVNRKKADQSIDQMKNLIALIERNPNDPLVELVKKRDTFYDPDLTPKISLRYVAVACGIGRLGWSGNLLTPEYGALVYLGGVVTDAKLTPDPPLTENPCNQCKICTNVCQGQFFDAVESQRVKIGEIEETIGKRHSLSKCVLSCGGFTGQSKFQEWGTWSPWRKSIPADDTEADKAFNQTLKEYLLAGGLKAQNLLRLNTDTLRGFGKAVKPVNDFRVYCAFCQLVCGTTEEDRRRNLKALQGSGVVELSEEKRLIIKSQSKSSK